MNDQQSGKILVLNGPGLAGTGIDGHSLESVRERCHAWCRQLGLNLEFRHTEITADMVHWIAKDSKDFDALVINPGGDSDTDNDDPYPAAVRAAMTSIAHSSRPTVEVHADNIFAEPEGAAMPLPGPDGNMGFVCGFGVKSYLLGIRSVAARLEAEST